MGLDFGVPIILEGLAGATYATIRNAIPSGPASSPTFVLSDQPLEGWREFDEAKHAC